MVEEVNEGQLLVLRRALSDLKGNRDEQRLNVFHLRCMVKGKVGSLIIDSGSSTNIAFLIMVEKLNLQAMTHPHPYNIQ